jgi:ABC-2 type transport system ATP-binding protein
MDEADRCDRVAIIDVGHLVAIDSPDKLKRSISGDVLHVDSTDPAGLAAGLTQRFSITPQIMNSIIRIEHPKAHEFIPQLVEAFPEIIRSVSLSKPTLEEVFMQRTGHAFEGRDDHE